MALNDVVFVKSQGGLGRALPGEDYISGLLAYIANSKLPSGFSTSNRIGKFLSLSDAENAGIKKDYSDETQSQGTVQITNKGTDGDTIELFAAEPRSSVSLGKYTKVSGDSTTTLVAVAIAAAINALTFQHGYIATSSTNTVTITARKGLGLFPNTGTFYSQTLSSGATIVTTITQNTVAGVASYRAILWYHISEFFRIQSKGVIFVGLFNESGIDYAFNDVKTIQDFADGKIRQIAVYLNGTAQNPFATTHIDALQTISTTLDGTHKPLSVLYGGDISATSDLSTLSNLQSLTDNKVSVVIGQDGGAGFGWDLWKATGKSITTIGAALGAVSAAKVSEDIAWVAKFNVSNGTELDTVAFANGVLFTALSDNLLSQLNSYKYIFLRKIVGISGTYFNDSHTAIAANSDFAFIEDNRTIDKAIRNIRTNILPDLNSPLTLKADGTLTDNTAGYFHDKALAPLEQMVRDGELSAAPDGAVIIDPSQNVLSSNKLVITVDLEKIGVARNIQINIGFVLSI